MPYWPCLAAGWLKGLLGYFLIPGGPFFCVFRRVTGRLPGISEGILFFLEYVKIW